MGGVDLLDQQIAAYHYRIRSKKLYWPIFAWSVNAQAVNGWILCKEHNINNTSLEFSRELEIATLKNYGKPRQKPDLSQTIYFCDL